MGATFSRRRLHRQDGGGRLRGATIVFPFVSVGATENLLMAAALADGRRDSQRRARAEISDLARCLNAMGAQSGYRQRPT
jgi:UDP-N-acetylglucosamine 1-carboxyvinyltransferase